MQLSKKCLNFTANNAQQTLMRTKYKRVLLKLSGESLMGAQGYGIDTERLNQ